MKFVLTSLILLSSLQVMALEDYSNTNPSRTKDESIQAVVTDPINDCEHCKFSQARLLDITNPTTIKDSKSQSTRK